MNAPALEELTTGYGLVEGPTVAADGSIFFSDVTGGGVFRRLTDGAIEVVVPKRRAVGGMCLHRDGGLVMSGRDLSHVHDRRTRVILTSDQLPTVPGAQNGFSDLCADERGRVFVGLGRKEPDGKFVPGELVVVGPGGVEEHDLPPVGLPNGIAVSADGSWLFQSDSLAHLVIRYHLGAAGRVVRDGEFSVAEFGGIPDGLATDLRGGLWAAMYGSGVVVELDPFSGTARSTRPLPFVNLPSLAFDGESLVVATAEDERHQGIGGLVRFPVGVAGAPVHAAAV